MLTNLWNQLQKYAVVIVIEALILGAISLYIHKSKNAQLDRANQNLIAMTDTIREVRLKNGDLLFEKSAWILKEKELSNVLDITEKEVKDLKKKLGSSLEYIAFLEGNVKIDTLITVRDSIVYVDDNEVHKFALQNPWLNIKGYHVNAHTTFEDIDVAVPLKVGLTDDYKIFVSSSNPYVSFNNIQGAVLDKSKLVRKPKFGWGIQLGVGANYGLIQRKFDVGPYMGVGAQINF